MRKFLLLFVLCLSGFQEKSFAAPISTFEEASKFATEVAKTSSGRSYDMQVSWELNKYFRRALEDCSEGHNKVEKDIQIIFVVSGDGRIRKILTPPNDTYSACAAKMMQVPLLRRPPKDAWPILIHCQFHAYHFQNLNQH